MTLSYLTSYLPLSQGLRTHYQHNMAGRNSFTSHAEEKNMANGNSKNTNDKDTKLDSLIDIERPSTEIGMDFIAMCF